ncbi:odorant receptor 82a-like isoform X2 [Tenebrio molitor]|uniref:odorant receptor 82a-like isoform X2 n=1 Tax=Tenebrio molitor TaxID=7067 RepID=UPI0036248688
MDFVPEGSVGFKVDPLRHLKYCLRLWGQKRRLLVLCYFVLAFKLFGFVLRTIFILKSMNNVEMLLEVSATYPIPLLVSLPQASTNLLCFFQAIVKLTYLLCRPSRVQFLLSPVETQFWNLSVAGARLRSYWDKRFLVINLLLLGHWLVCNGYVVLHLAFPYIPIPEGRTRWLPTLISIPFNTDATPLYEILYVILSWNMFVSVSGNGFFDFLFVYSAQHLCAQFAVLKAMLKKLDFGLLDHHNDLEKFNSQTFQREVHNRIVLCINHHNMLLRYGRELKNLSSLIFGVQLLTTLLTLVMTGYTLSQDFEELTKSTMLLSFVFSSAMQFSIFAFQSADIHHQSSSVAEAAYQCNWYLFNAKAKRGLTLLIMNSQQGISMCGAGIVVMDNRVIVKMAQKVFSCITLLRSLEQ